MPNFPGYRPLPWYTRLWLTFHHNRDLIGQLAFGFACGLMGAIIALYWVRGLWPLE